MDVSRRRGGLDQDYGKSIEYLLKSVGHGDPGGMNTLGYAYEWGYGVEQDLVESARWYALSAAKNYPDGLGSLAYCL